MPRTPPPPEVPPSRRFTDLVHGYVTVVQPGLRIKGELTGAQALELAGFDGPLSVEGLCHIHETARVVGAGPAGDAVVEGELQGSLTVRAARSSCARPPGSVAPSGPSSVALAEGCYFEGHIHMETGSEAEGPTSFQEKRRPR